MMVNFSPDSDEGRIAGYILGDILVGCRIPYYYVGHL